MKQLSERLIIQPMLKSEVALKYYGVTTETLMTWCRKAQIPGFGYRKTLLPAEIEQIFKVLGPPQIIFTTPSMNL